MGKYSLCLDVGNNAQNGESSQTVSEMHCSCIPVSQELNNELMLGSTVPCPLRRKVLEALSDARKAWLYCTMLCPVNTDRKHIVGQGIYM